MNEEYTLVEIEEDLYRLLDCFTVDEIKYLLEQIQLGYIDGQHYYANDDYCFTCIVGTLIRNRPELSFNTYKNQDDYMGYKYFLADKLDTEINWSTPIESYVLDIRPMTKPHHSEVLENIVKWIGEYLNERA